MFRGSSQNAGLIDSRTSAHRRYHFYGCAVDQIAGDSKFFDKSSLQNHGVRGANLTDTQLFANAGYVSTIDPAIGVTDSVIRIPNLNFDYNGGEKLILWWLGKVTPEGAAAPFMGDGKSATYDGISIRVNTAGTMQFALYDDASPTGKFSGNTVATPFDGTLHSFGIVLDGSQKKYGMWVDGTLEASFSGALGTFSSGASVDTRNSNTFQIGTSWPAAAGSTEGIATQTRALHILRLTASDTLPSVATITSMFQQLRANPGKPLLGSAF